MLWDKNILWLWYRCINKLYKDTNNKIEIINKYNRFIKYYY
jgi:hypothetical protein